MKLVETARLNFRRYIAYLLLCLPLIFLMALVIESLYTKSIRSGEAVLVPKGFEIELLLFAGILPFSYWIKINWLKINSTLKYFFVLVVALIAIDLMYWIYQVGYVFFVVLSKV